MWNWDERLVTVVREVRGHRYRPARVDDQKSADLYNRPPAGSAVVAEPKEEQC